MVIPFMFYFKTVGVNNQWVLIIFHFPSGSGNFTTQCNRGGAGSTQFILQFG